jgi:5'-nucleotidase
MPGQSDHPEIPMNILLTNDDGIWAIGLRAIHAALVAGGHDVTVVSPLTEQSAVGHAVTISMPLRTKEIRENGFTGIGVSGTPVDCVKLGLCALLTRKPDLVVSGINNGANVGVDILYSGTVSAATEGALLGLPALAVSVDDFSPTDLSGQAAWTENFIRRKDWSIHPKGCLLNLNFPDRPMDAVKGLRACPQTRATYRDWYDTRKDPRGRPYHWLDGVIPREHLTPGSDRALLTEGYITLTPLHFDFTDWPHLETLDREIRGWGEGDDDDE